MPRSPLALLSAELAVLEPRDWSEFAEMVGVEVDDAAVRSARLSLRFQGLIDGRGAPRGDVAQLLDDRRRARAVLVAWQETAATRQEILIFLGADDECLVHDVGPDRRHRFSRARSADALADLASWSVGRAAPGDPMSAGEVEASVIELSAERYAQQAVELVGWADRVTVFALRNTVDTAESQRRLSVFASHDRVVAAMGAGDGTIRLCRCDGPYLSMLLLSMFR